MKKMTRLLSLVFTFFSITVQAKQLSFAAGMYSIEATSASKPVSVSSFGSYRFSYSQNIWENFSFSAGYNLILEKATGGDKSYGLSFGANYYIGPEAALIKSHLDNVSVSYTSSLLPYIGFEFHQRQFQSTKTSYAGFGIVAGVEKYWRQDFSLIAEFRMITLGGTNNGEANEKTLMTGIALSL